MGPYGWPCSKISSNVFVCPCRGICPVLSMVFFDRLGYEIHHTGEIYNRKCAVFMSILNWYYIEMVEWLYMFSRGCVFIHRWHS